MSRDPGKWDDGYLSCQIDSLHVAAKESYGRLCNQADTDDVDWIRKAIAPWNDVGLLEPIIGQRIPHTAPPKYSTARAVPPSRKILPQHDAQASG